MARPLVIYTGPSTLDGHPIVCLATVRSQNVKTGPMVQTWIMRADQAPVEASQTESDASVCGSCPRRHSLGGDCYVLVHNAPQSAWSAWWRHGSPDGDVADVAARVADVARDHGVRLGSYGDPAAVPFQVWEALLYRIESIIGRAPLHTGYTHQWARTFDDPRHAAWLRQNVMASCDTPIEAALARSGGWRFFAALADVTEAPERSVQCLADRDGSDVTCETCGICDGAGNRAARASVWIAEHGARSGAKHKRIAALRVLQ